MTKEISREADDCCPYHSPGRVPDQEAPPIHARHAGHPGRAHPQPCDEARKENGRAAVASEKLLRPREHAFRVASDERGTAEESTPAPAAGPVADVVAHDCRHRRDDNDPADVEVSLRRQGTGGDQARFAGSRHAGRLERDGHEERTQAIRDDEISHRIPACQRGPHLFGARARLGRVNR